MRLHVLQIILCSPMADHILNTKCLAVLPINMIVLVLVENLIDPKEKPFIQNSKIMIGISLEHVIPKPKGDNILKLIKVLDIQVQIFQQRQTYPLARHNLLPSSLINHALRDILHIQTQLQQQQLFSLFLLQFVGIQSLCLLLLCFILNKVVLQRLEINVEVGLDERGVFLVGDQRYCQFL